MEQGWAALRIRCFILIIFIRSSYKVTIRQYWFGLLKEPHRTNFFYKFEKQLSWFAQTKLQPLLTSTASKCRKFLRIVTASWDVTFCRHDPWQISRPDPPVEGSSRNGLFSFVKAHSTSTNVWLYALVEYRATTCKFEWSVASRLLFRRTETGQQTWSIGLMTWATMTSSTSSCWKSSKWLLGSGSGRDSVAKCDDVELTIWASEKE